MKITLALLACTAWTVVSQSPLPIRAPPVVDVGQVDADHPGIDVEVTNHGDFFMNDAVLMMLKRAKDMNRKLKNIIDETQHLVELKNEAYRNGTRPEDLPNLLKPEMGKTEESRPGTRSMLSKIARKLQRSRQSTSKGQRRNGS